MYALKHVMTCFTASSKLLGKALKGIGAMPTIRGTFCVTFQFTSACKSKFLPTIFHLNICITVNEL